MRARRRGHGRWFALAERGGRFSLSAFWFSVTLGLSLLLVTAVVARFLIAPGAPGLVDGFPGLAALLGLPNAILAGAYTWGKKIDGEN